MVTRFAPVSARWRERHGIATGVGIGICRGEAIIGNIGSPHFMSYTVIGNTVNTAARLMQMAQGERGAGLRARCTRRSATWCRPSRVESRGDVALRGKSEAPPVYSIRL